MSDAELIAAFLAKNEVKKCPAGQRREARPKERTSLPVRFVPSRPKFQVRIKTPTGIVQHIIFARDAAAASARAIKAHPKGEVISTKDLAIPVWAQHHGAQV